MNSLTRKKEPFVTENGDRTVRWYMCGPTVYAPSHMGHARTYLGFDIIRRILTNYFNYDVLLVMNVTDVDDKIIARAAENGEACSSLSSRFEREFHEDMESLGVIPPDVLTRVTEYMEEIVTYVENIIKKGCAYESNGSVYFDVEAFGKEGCYPKLVPEQMKSEAETDQEFSSDKHSPRDFALWKTSKAGEPSWPSPWGEGRPGWHIECSAMASSVLEPLGGDKMDVHSGGIDLAFPHHDNEMAQAEAHGSCTQWVNYFIHAGHLHIKGFKMSKSLKNFISIRQALEEHSPRQIRLCFLMHKYNSPMDYGDNTMQHAVEKEKTLLEFFHNVKAALRAIPHVAIEIQNKIKTQHLATALRLSVIKTRSQVHVALRDDFDTPAALAAIVDLIKKTNVYLEESVPPIASVLRLSATCVTDVLRVFGLADDGASIGFAPEGGGGPSREETLAPVLDALLSFRSRVRDRARENNAKGVLEACDAFRDEALPPLGIRLEDKPTNSVWKLDDPLLLLKEKQAKSLEKERKRLEKLAMEEEKAKKELSNGMPPGEFVRTLMSDDGKTPKYSSYDDVTGMPTHWHDGEKLNKSQEKKSKKEFQAQAKKYEKYLLQQKKS